MNPVTGSEIVRRRVVVHGHVQGVFFRDSIREFAHGEGVSGWVANRDDGTVEAALEGSPAAVDAVLRFCREGPPRAEVRDLEVSDETPEGLNGFAVR
jgi:acylphosphatase